MFGWLLVLQAPFLCTSFNVEIHAVVEKQHPPKKMFSKSPPCQFYSAYVTPERMIQISQSPQHIYSNTLLSLWLKILFQDLTRDFLSVFDVSSFLFYAPGCGEKIIHLCGFFFAVCYVHSWHSRMIFFFFRASNPSSCSLSA